MTDSVQFSIQDYKAGIDVDGDRQKLQDNPGSAPLTPIAAKHFQQMKSCQTSGRRCKIAITLLTGVIIYRLLCAPRNPIREMFSWSRIEPYIMIAMGGFALKGIAASVSSTDHWDKGTADLRQRLQTISEGWDYLEDPKDKAALQFQYMQGLQHRLFKDKPDHEWAFATVERLGGIDKPNDTRHITVEDS